MESLRASFFSPLGEYIGYNPLPAGEKDIATFEQGGNNIEKRGLWNKCGILYLLLLHLTILALIGLHFTMLFESGGSGDCPLLPSELRK